MIKGIRHIGLVVNDLEKSLLFWKNALGFTVNLVMEESGEHIDLMMGLKAVKLTTVKLSSPCETKIELLYFHSHPDKKMWKGTPFSTGLTHIALEVESIKDVLNKMKPFGVTIPAIPQISADNKVKVIYANGPEGLLLELVELI